MLPYYNHTKCYTNIVYIIQFTGVHSQTFRIHAKTNRFRYLS